jgi:dihydroxy-acid dehydratase
MPEAGYIPIPRKLARAGVKDIVRISDGRMSGTAFGTIVLHVDARGGDRRAARPSCATATASASASRSARSRCFVGDAELAAARATTRSSSPSPRAATAKLFLRSVLQADEGCDFDFLQAAERTGTVPER